jgi:hypothetical protein
VAVCFRAPASLEEPGRHRHRGADLGPLRIRHVTRISACPPPLSDRTEPVQVAVTPRCDRGGRRHRETAQPIRQRASLVVLGVVTASLPRGPFSRAHGRTRTSVQMITRCRTPRTRSGLPQRTYRPEQPRGGLMPHVDQTAADATAISASAQAVVAASSVSPRTAASVQSRLGGSGWIGPRPFLIT